MNGSAEGGRIRSLAEGAGVSVAMTQGVEAGVVSSIEGHVRLAVALGLVPDFTLLRERAGASRAIDPVHAAMGELEARQIRPHAPVHLDEPYEHFQFAGRADLIAVSRDGTGHAAGQALDRVRRCPTPERRYRGYADALAALQAASVG